MAGTTAQGMLGGRQATGADFTDGEGMAQLGQGLQATAGVMDSFNKRLQEQQEQDEVVQAGVTIARKRREWTEQYIDRESKAEPGDKTFAPKLIEDIQTDLNKNGATFQTKKGQQRYAELTESTLGAFSEKALVTQTAMAGKKAVLDFNSELEDNKKTVSIDPMELPVILAMTKFDLSTDGDKYRDLKQSDRDALAKKVEQELLVAAISGLRTRDPVEALAMFQDAKSRLDPSVRYQLSERIFADAAPVIAAKVANAGKFTTVVDSEQTAMMLVQQGERLGIKVSANVLKDGDKESVLPADQQLKILLNAKTVMEQDRSQQNALIRDQINNASAAYGAGKVPDVLPDPEQVISVLGPVVGAIALRELDERRQFGDVAKRAKSMTLDEMNASLTADASRTGKDILGTQLTGSVSAAQRSESNINDIKAEIAKTTDQGKLAILNQQLAEETALLAKERVRPVTAGSLQANEQLAAVFRRTIDERNKDPAFAAYDANPTVKAQFVAAFDPNLKDPAAITAARAAYAQGTIAEQNRLGVANPRVLTNEMVNAFKSGMNPSNEDMQKSADASYQFLVGEQKKWGNEWPRVYRELAQSQAIDGVQMVAARMDSPDKATVAQMLLRAHGIGEKVLLKQLNQPEAFDRELRGMISKEMEPLRPALVKNMGGDQQFAAHANASYTLALSYMAHGGDNAKTASKKAVAELIGNDYTPTRDYLIPKRIDAGAVEYGAYLVKRNLDVYNIVPFDSFRGIKPDDAKKAMLDSVQTKGVWANNKDMTGLVLTVPNLKGGYDIVQMMSGDDRRRAVEFTWDEITKIPDRFGLTYTPGYGSTRGGAAVPMPGTTNPYGRRQ